MHPAALRGAALLVELGAGLGSASPGDAPARVQTSTGSFHGCVLGELMSGRKTSCSRHEISRSTA